jgi:hypothetical protein
MDTILSPDKDQAVVRYESVQVLNIKYPNGGDIGSKLVGQNLVIELTKDSKDPAIQMLIRDMNAYLLSERESPVIISDLMIGYRGELKGLNDFAALSQKLAIRMTINGLVMGELSDGQTGKLVDLNWRTFVISRPVFVQTEEYGALDINRPLGFIAATMPTLLNALAAEGTLSLLNNPSLDFSKLGVPMEQWRWDYDSNERITVIVTAGSVYPDRHDVSFQHQGVPYELELRIPAPSGTIQILGFAKAYAVEGNEAALVYDEPVGREITPLAVQILLGVGGLMAVIAIIVLLKARK